MGLLCGHASPLEHHTSPASFGPDHVGILKILERLMFLQAHRLSEPIIVNDLMVAMWLEFD